MALSAQESPSVAPPVAGDQRTVLGCHDDPSLGASRRSRVADVLRELAAYEREVGGACGSCLGPPGEKERFNVWPETPLGSAGLVVAGFKSEHSLVFFKPGASR